MSLNVCISVLYFVASESKGTVATGKGEDVKNTKDEKVEPMSVVTDEQPATLTAADTTESTSKPTPSQPQNIKTDEKGIVFSIGPSVQQIGAPHTNADKPMDEDYCAPPESIKIPTSSASFHTNADIPQDTVGPPFSAPPTPAHRHYTYTTEKQLSTPLFGNVPETRNESQPIHDPLHSQISYGDLQYPVQKVSMDDEAIMQRQQQRFKMIEEQNKTKPLQFKQTYSDPYSYKSTERVQSKQRRAQGWYYVLNIDTIYTVNNLIFTNVLIIYG